jgi:Na+(H+)/acetate symporter ActP
VLVFVFYQFHTPPVFFNRVEVAKVEGTAEYRSLEARHEAAYAQKKAQLSSLTAALNSGDDAATNAAQSALRKTEEESVEIKKDVADLIKQADPKADTNDTNYIFLGFVTRYLPVGMVGLLIAIIFLASMGSMASGLNSLASTTVVDVYRRLIHRTGDDKKYLAVSRWSTVGWGLFCIIAALYASRLGNLIEAVNILGSLFYGTILGIFVVGFYVKKVGGHAVFWGAVIAEVFVVISWWLELTAFLWLNVIGCLLVVGFAALFQSMGLGRGRSRMLRKTGN